MLTVLAMLARMQTRKVKISEARKLLQTASVKDDDVVEAAIQAVEQYGIGKGPRLRNMFRVTDRVAVVVIDEIDKICRVRSAARAFACLCKTVLTRTRAADTRWCVLQRW